MGLFSKLVKAVKFQFSHVSSVLKGLKKNPLRVLTGGDPLSTTVWNKVLGTKYKPLFGQLGGATPDQFNDYEAKHGAGSLGFAKALHTVAETVLGFYAGGALGKVAGKVVSTVGSKLAGTAAGSAAGTTTGAVAGGATEAASSALPEIVVTGTRAGAGAANAVASATGAGIGATGAGGGAGGDPAQAPRSADSTLPPGSQPPAAAPTSGGFLSGLKNFATSEGGLQIIGGALQGYASDKQQQRAIDETRRYTRPFTTDEISGITRGMDVKVPGGFLENARRVGEFLNGPPRIGPSTLTPEQVAAMARGG